MRRELIARSPEHQMEMERFIAAIDFRNIANDPHIDPQEAIVPLLNYLSNWGESDPDRWQTEMTIAQYLSNKGMNYQAGEWAQDAYRHAPQEAKEPIHQFIDRASPYKEPPA